MTKKIIRSLLIICAIVVLNNTHVIGQDSDELYIFGFSQTIFNSKIIESTAYPYPADNPQNGIPFISRRNYKTNTFALHQLNLFFRKPINEKTTFFLNLEATGSYSSQLQSGNFQIPEGWISYRFNDRLMGRVGLLVPTFNNLNEIKNRLPLFPYLIRPTIYEALFYGIFNEEDYVPQSAYMQLRGNVPLNENYIFNYAVHLGNSEGSYFSNVNPGNGAVDDPSGATIYKGENLTTKLGFGGRVGISNILETFKFGVSLTRDHDNRNETAQSSIAQFQGIVLPAFGDVLRYRVGVDLSFTISKFNFESEYIGVFHNHDEIRKTPQYSQANLNKSFYYTLLTYNITDEYYVFGGFNEFRDRSYDFLLGTAPDGSGVKYVTGGFGWRPLDSVVLKGQFSNVFLGENPHADVNVIFLTAGVSVIF